MQSTHNEETRSLIEKKCIKDIENTIVNFLSGPIKNFKFSDQELNYFQHPCYRDAKRFSWFDSFELWWLFRINKEEGYDRFTYFDWWGLSDWQSKLSFYSFNYSEMSEERRESIFMYHCKKAAITLRDLRICLNKCNEMSEFGQIGNPAYIVLSSVFNNIVLERTGDSITSFVPLYNDTVYADNEGFSDHDILQYVQKKMTNERIRELKNIEIISTNEELVSVELPDGEKMNISMRDLIAVKGQVFVCNLLRDDHKIWIRKMYNLTEDEDLLDEKIVITSRAEREEYHRLRYEQEEKDESSSENEPDSEDADDTEEKENAD